MRNSKPKPIKEGKVAIVPDVHQPYHDQRAWDLAMTGLADYCPDILIQQGDLMDCYRLSRFDKDPKRMLSFDDEVEGGKQKRADLDSLGAKRKIFTEGNHENWLRIYLMQRAPELFNMVSMDKILEMTDNGWEYIPYKQDIRIGKVFFTHDLGYSGQNALKQTLKAYQHSSITAHTHRMGYMVENDATGRSILSCSFGWLGDADQVDYRHQRLAQIEWSLGFGTGYLTSKGVLYTTPHPIVDYRCNIEGKEFRG